MQSFAFSFRLSKVGSLIEWKLSSSSRISCKNLIIRNLNSFSSHSLVDVRIQGDPVVQNDVRGVLLAKRPDSSFGGVPVGYCPDEVHMEEEGVQVKVQVEEEIGETHGKEQSEEKGRAQTIKSHT